MDKTTHDRFYERTQLNPQTGCLEWIGGYCGGSPYGIFWYDGRQHKAHRVAWMLVHGDIPEGMEVCHTCDNPRCVRVGHLFLGDHAANMQDAARKGRINTQKLTLDQRNAIILLHATRLYSITRLSRMFGVHHSTISRIVNRKRWAWAS